MDRKKMRSEKLARQMAIMSQAKTEKRDLTTEEQAELDVLQREIDTLNQEIEEEERQEQGQQKTEDVLQMERQRAAEITGLCREFGLDASKYISDGSTVDKVRAAVIAQMRNEKEPLNVPAHQGEVSVAGSAEDKFRLAAVDALLMRGGVQVAAPAEGAAELRGLSLRDIAIEALGQDGKQGLNRQSSDELFNELQRGYFNPTSAFNSILDTAINKAYVEGHKSVQVTFDRFTKKGSLSDFKTHDNNYLAGPAGEFLEVPEGAELKHETPTDKKRPARKLHTYGRQFTMTRQAFINDDIGFLSTVPAKHAASARKTINKQVYQILCNNPAIYDGTVLFSEAHKNVLAAGTGITREALQKMIVALQTQLDEFGEAIIVNPATLVVPSGYAFDIYTILYSATINTSGNTQAVNPLYRYREMIEVVEDPTINVLCGGFGKVMPWFLIGAQADTDFIEVDYLNGQEIPNIRRMETPGQLGFVWDIYLDWGITVMDYRGAVKNPGIEVADPLA